MVTQRYYIMIECKVKIIRYFSVGPSRLFFFDPRQAPEKMYEWKKKKNKNLSSPTEYKKAPSSLIQLDSSSCEEDISKWNVKTQALHLLFFLFSLSLSPEFVWTKVWGNHLDNCEEEEREEKKSSLANII